MNPFPDLNIDRLRDIAHHWIKAVRGDLGIGIERITLYQYRASIPMEAFLGLSLGDDEAGISPLKYAVIFTLTCPGKAPESNEHAMCPHSSIESFVSRYTSHKDGIPTFALDSIKGAYIADAPANYSEQWMFLPDCDGPGCKGTALPTEVKIDEPSALLFDEDKSFSLLIKNCEKETSGKNQGRLKLPPSQNPNILFPELNIKKLWEISEGWATQFQKQDGFFNQIILCRYTANRFYEFQAPKYAVVLDVRHYEKPDYIEGPRHVELFMGELLNSPYCSLVRLTNYAAWAKGDPKGSRAQLKKYFPWNYFFFNEEYQRNEVDYQKKFIEQTGFETPSDFVSAGIPYYFEEDNFTDVYVDRVPDNWRHQWLFIPLFKGCELPNQIQIKEIAVIYPNDSTIEPIDEHQTPEILTKDTTSPGVIDPNKWQFRYNSVNWEIEFKGRRYSINDDKPVRYMIPLIKQPDVPFMYTVLCHLVDGGTISDDPTVTKNFKDAGSKEEESDFVDDLNYQGHTEMEYTKEQIDKMRNYSDRVFQKYRNDMGREEENWKLWKAHVLDEYGLLIKEHDGELMYKKPKHQSNIDMAESYRIAKNRVSQYKGRFLKQLKKKNHIKLYEHFKQYLEPTGGGIQYTVPKGEPPWNWEVIE